MSLDISDRGLTYAPQFETFARELSDETAERIRTDPVVRSRSVRQAADIVEPDWLVVSGVRQILAALRGQDARARLENGYSEGTVETVDHLTEFARIVSAVRSEPVVCRVPDHVTMAAEVLGEEWRRVLSEETARYLELLHVASQFLTDVLRGFRGTVSGLVVDATHLPEALDEGLSLGDYLLELGAVFNLADHYGVTIVASIPSGVHEHCEEIGAEFDAVILESVEQSMLPTLPAQSVTVGCSFTESIWEADDTAGFRRGVNGFLEDLPGGVSLFAQEIPATVRPEHVRVFGDMLDTSV